MPSDFMAISTEHLTRDLLTGLFENTVAVVRVPCFISPDQCELAAKSILAHGIGAYTNVFPPVGKLGISQNEFKGDLSAKDQYFARVSGAVSERDAVVRDGSQIVQSVIDHVGNIWGTGAAIAVEVDSGLPYFAGIIRVINLALLHFDWAPHDAPNWTIAATVAQLTWNIYLQTGESGGKTRVYRRLWQESDEAHRMPSSYGFDDDVVHECDFVDIEPQVGELALFNPRNYHEVYPTEGTKARISISSFFGLQPSGALAFWS